MMGKGKYQNGMGYIKNYKHTDPSYGRRWHLMKNYGITLEQFNEILERQNGKCAICGTFLAQTYERCVDHNETTGTVRGILCRACNMAIGLFREDVTILNEAIEYLSAFQEME